MKTTYKATFSDGTTAEAKSTRKCTVAYKLTTPKGTYTGFSISAEAAKQQLSSLRIYYIPKYDMSKDAEAARKENEQYKAASSIEIVPITI
jgi:hypothetical protein